jgi:hypothetical protein
VFVKGEMVKMHQAPASEEELANHFLAMSEAERRKRLADVFVNLFALYIPLVSAPMKQRTRQARLWRK